jgi:glyoxylase-like metal-dependent hydrolase (beta-lactamase superfamily II)
MAGAAHLPDAKEVLRINTALMDSAKVLVQGYALKEKSGRYKASSAAVLVSSAGKLVLVDPGLYPKELKTALDREQIKIDSIDIVVSSHSHQDHTRNSKLFEKAKVFDPFKQHKNIPENLVVPGTQVKVIFTPGHVDKHVSFLVDTAEGRCAIAGDVFWWEDTEEQKTDRVSLMEHIDPLAKDLALLQESRKKLLSLADYIIPGHGKVFAVPR